MKLTFGAVFLLLTACPRDSSTGDDDDDARDAQVGADDAGGSDAGEDAAPVDQAARCAVECAAGADPPEGGTCFGDELTDGFGRIDGTILAVQRPTDTECAWPNDDHLVVQVLMHGAAYRMVVNVLSDGRNGTDTRLRFADVPAALPAPEWSEGWHLGVALDYADTLGVHAQDDFTPYAMDDLVEEVASRLVLDAPISVYATSDDRPESTHLIHRNGGDHDGALVVDPTGAAPHSLLFHFDGQEF